MSRIERPRVEATETTDATTLNNTYDDYSQTGALNEDNTRNAAFDVSHMTNASILVNSKVAQLGNTGMLHTAPTTTCTHTTSLASPKHHVVQDSTGTETILNIASSPWTVATGDIIRVFWDLSVNPGTTGTPWNDPAAKGRYGVETIPAGGIVITDGLHCWAAYLEWDITDATLNNFVTVPNQDAFTESFNGGADKGIPVSKTTATTLISAWTVFNLASAQYGKVPYGGSPAPPPGTYQSQGWFGTHGMWAYKAVSGATIYGIRVVLTGLLHPAHITGGSNQNVLLFDINVTGSLEYKGGRLTAIQMRGE
tara:strand:- start:1794 stop:2723 length:930 start_codon:yes stop_codon:yes gene_type:complete